MHGTLIVDGQKSAASSAAASALVSAGTPFWLDLDDVDQDASDFLGNVLHVHPLVLEDAEKFGQRPKIEEFDDFTYFVVHGAVEGGGSTSELHIFFMKNVVVTAHHGECPALIDVRERMERRHMIGDTSPQVTLLYMIVDSIVDTYFPEMSRFDDKIDTLEDDILRLPTEAQLGVLFDMKKQLIAMRRVVAPQRDMFASLAGGVVTLPGMTEEGQRYFRDLYDHLIRIADTIDSYRDLLSGVMDTHVSTVSNRLNVVMKQLTIIATVFLPLSFLTGFFGQNFAWLVRNIAGGAQFLLFGLGIELLTVVGLVVYFRRKGWLGGPTA
jgi:magnesium transporter